MKSAVMWAAILAAFASSAHGSTTYGSYDAFYAAQSRAAFGGPIEHDASVLYSDRGGDIYGDFSVESDGKTVHVELAGNRIAIGGKIHRFSNATTFPGEHPVEIYPGSASVFFAQGMRHRPSALCVEGSGSGSGEANRHQQIYLLINPFAAKKRVTFLHLPSLLSSCRAVLATQDGKLAFPKNTYLLDDAQASRIGLLMSYYAFEKRRFVPVLNDIRLRFMRPDVPFQFSVQDKE
ncbi:hypothetical protein DIE21_08575 [Burkholderia sp. Bp9140]|uniref:hypothetical protein n=1 Tax=Burkholderia sp. Bp9140 TaxID=2184572 RepID=UPI000F57E0D7|nr:hypothetical protein [Burkholderia sp. Bp9140]RQR54309.1 hypothetical protein DIE21_08575 [Burkholderia sp. Bp9140]